MSGRVWVLREVSLYVRVFFRALNERAAIRNKNHAEHAEHDVRVLVPQQLLLQGSRLQQIKNRTFDEIATSNAMIVICSAAPLLRCIADTGNWTALTISRTPETPHKKPCPRLLHLDHVLATVFL